MKYNFIELESELERVESVIEKLSVELSMSHEKRFSKLYKLTDYLRLEATIRKKLGR